MSLRIPYTTLRFIIAGKGVTVTPETARLLAREIIDLRARLRELTDAERAQSRAGAQP